MSRIRIRKALETALGALSPAIATAWENVNFTPPSPPTGQTTPPPYQKVTLSFAEPRNTEFGPVYQEQGYMQVQLVYPAGTGSATAEARAAMIRSAFPRGATFTADGQTVMVNLTPNILPGFTADDGRYVLTVRVPFFAQVATN